MHFNYTDELTPYSSLVEGVYYNDNDQTLVLDLNDSLYYYNGVEREAVTELVSAASVGAHYNTVFKQRYGPAEPLGSYNDVTFNNTRTKKNLVDNTNTVKTDALPVERTFSLQTPDDVRSERHFSLSALEDKVNLHDDVDETDASDVYEGMKTTVFFTIEGTEREFEFVSSPTSCVEDAIDELNVHIRAFGARGRVSKVVVEFE